MGRGITRRGTSYVSNVNESLRRGVLPTASVAVLGILTAAAAVTGTYESGPGTSGMAPPPCAAVASHFSGYYVRRAEIDQISASWDVPRIAASADVGNASTWVGIQARRTYFVQLGTDERVVPGPSIEHPALAQYQVFWSDTALHYLPRHLLNVSAGDLVETSISRLRRGWRLHVLDATENKSVSLVVGYGRQARFVQGEWLQEDASNHCTDGTYPTLSDVTFRSLRVNGVVPRLSYDHATVLESANGVNLVPSRIHHDSFSVARATGTQAQYLRDTANVNVTWLEFVGALRDWNRAQAQTRPMIKVEIDADAALLISAIKGARQLLISQHWPPGAEWGTRVLASQASLDIATLRNWTRRFTQLDTLTCAVILQRRRGTARRASRLRHSLHLPAIDGLELFF